MGTPEMEQLDLAIPTIELHRALKGNRRQRRLERAHLGQIGFGELQIGLELGALRGARALNVGLELGDLAWDLAHVVLDALESLLHHRFARDVVGDDLGVGVRLRIDLVAVPVIPVEVRVDHVADGFAGEIAQLLDDHPGRRRLRVRVDHHDAVRVLDDRGVAIHLVGGGCHGRPDSVGDLLDVEPRVPATGSFVSAAIHRELSLM